MKTYFLSVAALLSLTAVPFGGYLVAESFYREADHFRMSPGNYLERRGNLVLWGSLGVGVVGAIALGACAVAARSPRRPEA